MTDETQKTRLIPLADWPKYHPWPPIGGLRHIAFNSESNGFNEAIIRVGRRVLIDESKFFECARQQGQKSGA